MTASLSSNLGLLAFLLASSLLVAESLAKESRETTRSPPKAKKSAEDIMFGNQQNKPAGMVDDLLTSLPERDAGEPKSQTRNQTRPADHANPTNATTDKRKRDRGDEKSDSEKSSSNKESSDERGASLDSRKFDYYDYLQEADESRLADPGVEGYRLESIEERNSKATGTTAGDASSANLPADGQTYNQRELGDYPEEDYDGVLYRRKRTPRRTPMAGSSSFTRQRSVRSNLDDLLAGNGGRRALRLKRDVGVERFLAWLDALSHRQQPQQLGQQREDDPGNDCLKTIPDLKICIKLVSEELLERNCKKMNVSMTSDPWRITPEMRAKYDEQFYQLKPINGLITGDQAKKLFLLSGLPPQILAQVWALSDTNSDGKIDRHEFGIALLLIQMKLKGYEIPETLPASLRPPPPIQQIATFGPPLGAVNMGPLGTPSVAISRPGVSRDPAQLASSGSVPQIQGPPNSSMADHKAQRSGSVSSQDSPTFRVASPGLTEWAIPQPSKLKYTQYFNSLDRSRTGYLTGVQARNILLQSALPQNVLAQIWNLADIDSDGRLGSEEFVLAMHLIDCSKAGDILPTTLPPDLYPPSYRQRGRSASVISTGSASQNLLGDLSGGGEMSKEEEARQKALMTTFEDKRRENFEKGQAELERRRQMLLENQRKEREERQRKDQEEREKRERQRLEQERRRQLELEKQLAKQRELEREKEEQRRKVLEQREAARREMERQRQLEWERQRLQELSSQKQREQVAVSNLKKKSKSLTIELEQLNNKINDLSQHIGETRQGVAELKASIDEMRIRRDSKMSELANYKMQIKDLNDKLLAIAREKTNVMNQALPQTLNNPTTDSFNSVVYSFNNKQIMLNQLRNTLSNIEKETTQKLQDVENNNAQLQELKDTLQDLMKNHEKLFKEYEEKRQQVLALKKQKEITKVQAPQGWDDPSKLSITEAWVDQPGEPTTPSASSIQLASENQNTGMKFIRYRALYAFEARNLDELSIMPGDIVLVPESQSTEPGWLGGELRGKAGWFPESYAERLDTLGLIPSDEALSLPSSTDAAETVHIVGTEIKFLEGISEAPENGSDFGSITEEPAIAVEISQVTEARLNKALSLEAASPVPGEGQAAPEGLQAVAMFPWRAKKDNHLTFNKGDVIAVIEQQDMWWLGKSGEITGWFPKSYVKLISGGGRKDSESLANSEADELDNRTKSGPPSESTAGEFYVANYAYQSQESGDLCFQQGDLILVTKKDGDWWTGTLGEISGVFPSNYLRPAEPGEIPGREDLPQPENVFAEEATEALVSAPETEFSSVQNRVETEIEETNETNETIETNQSQCPSVSEMSEVVTPGSPALDSPKPKNTKTLKKPEIVTVIAPYKATGAEQLNLERGQLIQVRKKSGSGWWEGEIHAKGKKRTLGWFPASYVKPISGSRPSSARSTPDPVTQMSRQSEELNGTIERVVAVYGFAAQHPDELTFQKGQTINLINREDPAWWRGELDGAVGLFPSNYVVPLEKTATPTLTQGQWSGDWKIFNALPNREKKRQSHIDELIRTEETYNENMSFVLDVFHKPLKESGLLSDEELKTIFVNWKELLVCNNKLLKALRVRKKMSSNGLVQMIGDILCENIPHMTVYIRFCSCQLRAATLIQQKNDNVKEFKQVTKQCSQDPRTRGMPLSTFLIKPMQRLTQYPLVIKKILEYTPQDQPDHDYLSEALSLAEQLCNRVNEGVRERENTDRLEWMQTHIHYESLAEELIFNSLTNCLGPRKLLHSGTLIKVKSNKELIGFLFNDFLLLTQPSKDVGKVTNVFTSERASSAEYKIYKKPIFLNCVRLNASPDNIQDDAVFQIHQLDSVLPLKAANSNERILWVKKIDAAIKDYIETEKKNLSRQHSISYRPSVGKLRVLAVQASELGIILIKGHSDPYCEITMGSQEHRTKVVSNSTNPKWNASMQFLIKDIEQDVLCISVFDRDLFSPNNFLGRTEIRVEDIYRESREVKGPITKKLLLYEVETGEVELKLDIRVFDDDS